MNAMRIAIAGLMVLGIPGVSPAEEPAREASAAPQVARQNAVALNIPSQPIGKALTEFARQSGLQVMLYTKAAEGITAPSVVGKYTPDAALALMLANAPLRVQWLDGHTVAIHSRAAIDTGKPAAGAAPVSGASLSLARVEGEDTVPAAESTQAEEGSQPAEIVVTGSSIRGRAGEVTAQPVTVFTREDLDRFGVNNVQDLGRLIPQMAPQAGTSQQGVFQGVGVGRGSAGRSDFGKALRGLGGTGTLVLVNGRRVQKLGQSGSGAEENYDLNGIPMAAVERIEVLTDGASAIYGADALAGVINIILRQGYAGTELSTSYANTFDTDTGEFVMQLTHGRRTGNWTYDFTLNHQQNNALAIRDRPNITEGIEIPVRSGPGSVMALDGSTLNGLGVFEAMIPAGADGVTNTLADFAAAGPLTPYVIYTDLFENGGTARNGVRASGSYEFNRWMTVGLEGNWNEVRQDQPGQPAFIATVVPEDYPGNPFGENLLMLRMFPEMQPYTTSQMRMNAYNASAYMRGDMGRSWRYETRYDRPWSDYRIVGAGAGGTFDSNRVPPAIFNPDPAQRPILLNDGTRSAPNSPEMYRSFLTPARFRERPSQETWSAVFDGPLAEWAGGTLRMAAGLERRNESVSFDIDVDSAISDLQVSVDRYARTTDAVFAELRVPLLGEKRHVPLVHKLEATVSARRDDYSDFGSDTVFRYGLLYRPVQWLALRASYGEGFKVPSLIELYQPEDNFRGTPIDVRDPLRGNQLMDYAVDFISGGNASLRPERSENISAGMVLDVPGVKGWSITLDYYDIKNIDRVGRPNFAMLVTGLMPDLVVRDAPSDGFAVGRVLSLDVREHNFAYLRVSGWDFETRYQRALGDGREWYVRFATTRPTRREEQVDLTLPLLDLSPSTSRRSSGTAAYRWRGFETSVTGSYTDDYFAVVSFSEISLPSPSSLIWSMQFNYDFERSGAQLQGWLRPLFEHSNITLTLHNVLDWYPRTGDDVGTVDVDPRMRRYQLSFRKQF